MGVCETCPPSDKNVRFFVSLRQSIVYQSKLSKLNVGGVVDILYQVDELRSSLDQIIPKLKENGISGKVLRHCDLKELKNVSVSLCNQTATGVDGPSSSRYLI